MRSKRLILLLALLALFCLAGAYFWFAPSRTPAGQLALIDLDRAGFPAFEQLFDDAAAKVRVVGLFSPT
ncbi:MAG TPA: hypothetical protein VL285_23315 [Bryobacteraceae bacterium]|nr:hypothetical protein [Bryobacteraceae bacterium]